MNAAPPPAPPPESPDQEIERRLKAIDAGIDKVRERVRDDRAAGVDTPIGGFSPARMKQTQATLKAIAAVVRPRVNLPTNGNGNGNGNGHH